MEIYTFEDALRIAGDGQRHLLIGNGFSIACKPDIFRYGALFDRADFSSLSSEARGTFNVLKTTDFEDVMQALKTASELVGLYAPENPALANRLAQDAEALREVLVRAIADSHPAHPFEIDDAAYSACRLFLKNFGHIYSVNYDLLLYWAAMRQELEPKLDFDDGFRTPEDGVQEYVTWEVENTNQQTVYYLHGALHVFDAGSEIQKYTWSNTGIRLIDQIRQALANGLFPLIVAEGASSQKLAHINHSNYLSRNYRSFANITGTLFVFGHSMGENDEHVLKLIQRNRRLRTMAVGVFGDPDSDLNKKLIASTQVMQASRPQKSPLQILLFDSGSARVWG